MSPAVCCMMLWKMQEMEKPDDGDEELDDNGEISNDERKDADAVQEVPHEMLTEKDAYEVLKDAMKVKEEVRCLMLMIWWTVYMKLMIKKMSMCVILLTRWTMCGKLMMKRKMMCLMLMMPVDVMREFRNEEEKDVLDTEDVVEDVLRSS